MKSQIGNASTRLPFCSGTAFKSGPCFQLLIHLMAYLVVTAQLGRFMSKERRKLLFQWSVVLTQVFLHMGKQAVERHIP
ncbi:hypothetical protein CsSME_00025470 [Camellia sinensis var. sinensis]